MSAAPSSSQAGPVEIARTAWGEGLPEWVEALAVECAATSQNRVAARMGRSAAMISQVLRQKYPGNLAAVEETFRGVFREARVDCPASINPIPANECQDWRRKSHTYATGNPLRGLMFRACNRCTRNTREDARRDTANPTDPNQNERK